MRKSRVISGTVSVCIAIGLLCLGLGTVFSQVIGSASATGDDANDDIAIDKEPPKVCYTIATLTADPNLKLVNQWQRRYFINEMHLDQKVRHLTVAQLEAEAASGNIDAMYKLGVKYMSASIKSRHSKLNDELSPAIAGSDNTSAGGNSTSDAAPDSYPKPNLHYLEKSRDWFWQAALRGRLQAFGGISTGYVAIQNYENNNSPTGFDPPQSAAYRLLMQEIHADLAEVLGVTPKYISIKPEDQLLVQKLLVELRARWQQQRQAMGLPFKLDIPVPDYVKTFAQKWDQICPSDWPQRGQ